ncbi:MAG: toprim domain-containing protein, partial [Alphaproteobacteria bacterium]
TLAPLDGVGPQDLAIEGLVARAHEPRVTEIILALNATVDGQTTAHYITDLLHDAGVKVTRLAHGVHRSPARSLNHCGGRRCRRSLGAGARTC